MPARPRSLKACIQCGYAAWDSQRQNAHTAGSDARLGYVGASTASRQRGAGEGDGEPPGSYIVGHRRSRSHGNAEPVERGLQR